jgi:hypothetical protein
MDWKESLRQTRAVTGLTGRELIAHYLSTQHNSPGLPPHVYDGNDPMPLLRRLSLEERAEFGITSLVLPEAVYTPVSRRVEAASVQAQPVYTTRVHVICCADDNGGNSFADPKTVSQWIEHGLKEANAIYAARGAGIELVWISGDIELRKSTLLNQDFVVPPNTNMNTPSNQRPLSDAQIKQLGAAHESERNRVALLYPDRLIYYLACGTDLRYNQTTRAWMAVPRVGYAYSGTTLEFVIFPSQWGSLHGPEIAHESGHYFHLWHTHGYAPKTLVEAAQEVRDYVAQHGNDQNIGLQVFDGDIGSGVIDTPPDPGPDFFHVATGQEACTINLNPSLVVDFGGGQTRSYQFSTDRGNVMSYFKDCPTFQQHVTQGQIALMRDALAKGNRHRLVATQLGETRWPKLRYSALWNAGQGGNVWWTLCTEDELRKKTAELWGSMRLTQMIGFVLDGQVFYCCIWEPGTYPQVWWPNCSEQQFRDKTGELWATMRPKQVHAFVLNGEPRFNCIWNVGTEPVVFWENCSEQQFRDKTGELWSTMRPSQMHGFVLNGEPRYSCLWRAGTDPVVWWERCTEDQFRQKTGELWSSMRPAQLQAFEWNSTTHFSAIWRSGTMPQIWWPLCTEEQLRQQTGDTWNSMRPAQWMPFAQ